MPHYRISEDEFLLIHKTNVYCKDVVNIKSQTYTRRGGENISIVLQEKIMIDGVEHPYITFSNLLERYGYKSIKELDDEHI